MSNQPFSVHVWRGESSSASYCERCGKDYRDGYSSPCVPDPQGATSKIDPSPIEDCIEAAQSAWRVLGCSRCDRRGDEKASAARADLSALRARLEAAEKRAAMADDFAAYLRANQGPDHDFDSQFERDWLARYEEATHEA